MFLRLKILTRESPFYGKNENWDRNAPLNYLSKGMWHHIKIRERKGSIARRSSKVRPQV